MNIEEEVRRLTREGYKPTQIMEKLDIKDLKDFPIDIYRDELRKIRGREDDSMKIKKDMDEEESEKTKEEKKREEEEEEEKEEEEEEEILPYPKTIKPPEEWFEEFIKPFGVSKEFLRIYKQRIKRRKELPHPNELAADLADMKSGITNARAINYIAEEYAYALEEYMREIGENERLLRRSFGIRVAPPRPSLTYPTWTGGYNYSHPEYYYPPTYYSPPPPPAPNPSHNPHNSPNPYNHPYNSPDHPIIQELNKLREELRRIKERPIRTEDPSRTYIQQLLQRIEKLEDELKERDKERIEKLERELERAREGGISRQEIENMVHRILEEYRTRLTPEDVERIIKEHLDRLNIQLSKEDREYLIAKEKINLEREKLKESGETKKMIANAVRTGLASIGEAISRTLMESGTQTSHAVVGTQIGNIWKVACPNCGATITAPVGKKDIVCPKCGARYSVQTSPATIPASPTSPPPSPSLPTPKQPTPPPAPTIETEEKFVCPECGKEFDSEKKLRGHMLHHAKRKKHASANRED